MKRPVDTSTQAAETLRSMIQAFRLIPEEAHRSHPYSQRSVPLARTEALHEASRPELGPTSIGRGRGTYARHFHREERLAAQPGPASPIARWPIRPGRITQTIATARVQLADPARNLHREQTTRITGSASDVRAQAGPHSSSASDQCRPSRIPTSGAASGDRH